MRFRWENDSLAFWDNRSTAHLGPVDLASSDFDRRVERVTIVGDLPVGPDGFESIPLRGERLYPAIPHIRPGEAFLHIGIRSLPP